MSTGEGLPRSAKRLIASVLVLGVAAVALRLRDVGAWTWGDVSALVALAAGGALAEQLNISIRHRTETENFTVTDALWVPALLFARPSVLTFTVVLTTVVGQSIKRWTWYKIAFNAAQFAVAITVAELVLSWFPAPGRLTLLAWTATTCAMVAYFVVNETLVGMVIAAVEHEPLSRVLVLPAALNLLHAGANVTIGMIGALVWSTGPSQLPLLAAPLGLSFLAYRGWLQSSQEEQQAKELMRSLYQAGRALFGRVDVSFDFQPFLDEVRRMVNASSVELVLVEGDAIRVHTAEGVAQIRVRDGAPRPADHLPTPPDDLSYLAAVTADGEAAGVLAVRRRPPLSPSEGSLVEALASQLSIMRENDRLFHQAEQQRRFLADVIATSSDGILVVGHDARLVSWNPAMARITRVPRDRAVGRPLGEVLRVRLDQDDGDATAALPLDATDPQAVLIVREDGSERWIRYASRTMHPDRAGEGAAFVVVARDVTSEVEADRMKSDFIATVSHELRTPLTPVKGFLISLRDDILDPSPEARAEYYAIMLRQVERLERLIDDLLDVSRIDSDRVPLEPMLVDLRAQVRELIEDALRQPGARPVSEVLPEDGVWVRADPFRLGQVLMNLLSNAFKYTPPEAAIEVRLGTEGCQAVVEVHDDGPGIPTEEQARVFERFYRVDRGLTRNTTGAGLGLYIARRLIDAMGGELSLRSSPGEGTTFRFTLPSIESEVLSGAQPKPVPATHDGEDAIRPSEVA